MTDSTENDHAEPRAELEIVPFRVELKRHFAELNLAWIERWFRVEAADRRTLEHPGAEIVEKGGEVLFALDGGRVIGTCALIRHEEGVYELSKMAVDPSAQGRGCGARLMEEAIAWVRSQGGQRMFLESNTVLASAIRLYERFGFRTTRRGPVEGGVYERSNIEMMLDLDPPAGAS